MPVLAKRLRLESDLTLSIGDSVLQPSTVVRNLSVYIDEHLSMEAMLVTVPRLAFSTCDRSVSFAVTSTMIHWIRWYVHWYCHVWIIATVCLHAAHSLHSTVCSVCKTLLLDFSVALLHGRMHHLSWSSSTGWQCRAEFSLNCALQCLTSIMALLHNTRQNSSGAVTTPGFGPTFTATSSFHVLGFVQLTKLFPSLGHVPGMHCRLTLNSSQLVPASARGSRHTF